MLDGAMDDLTYNRRPATNPAVTAPASAPVDFGYMSPASSYYATPIYTEPAQAPAYQAPAYQAPSYQAAVNNTPSFGIGAPTGGGYGGAPAPAPPPKPVISDSDWLAGDSQYQNALSGLDSTLQSFLARIAKQRDDFNTDYGTAVEGFNKNRDRQMLNLGEDFTSRGLANSGLFADARNRATSDFNTQKTGMETARDRSLADFGRQEQDRKDERSRQGESERLSSLARKAASMSF